MKIFNHYTNYDLLIFYKIGICISAELLSLLQKAKKMK